METEQPLALIVEDDHEMRALMAELLQMEGYRVITESDGQAGFRKATTADLDLLVVDIGLPNWSGLDLLHSLALVGSEPRVLVVTGRPASEIAPQVRHPWLIGVLEKPFSVDQFLGLVRR